MRTTILVDLDDSLITQRKSEHKAKPVEFHDDGTPASFHTGKQSILLSRLRRGAKVVPTTGRNTRAFRRIQVGFGGHAICSFGGTILTPENEFEPRWRSIMQEQVTKHRRSFDEVLRSVQMDTDYNPHVIADDGMRLYIKLDYADPRAEQDVLTAEAAKLQASLPEGWRLFRNGYHCCAQPPYIGKEKAVTWYLENLTDGKQLVIGLGDSFLDAAFLGLCDFALLPTDSQLFGTILSHKDSQVTP